MGWLKKIFSGSDKINTRSHYHEESDDDVASNYHVKSPIAGSESDNDEIDHVIALSLADEEHQKGKAVETSSHTDEDEVLARALQESLNAESPPHRTSQVFQPFPYLVPLEMFRVCAGCRTQIGEGRFRNFMGHSWHSECFRCCVCLEPMSEAEAMMHKDLLYHKSCFKDQNRLICHVCKSYIPTDRYGRIEYRVHPFWQEKFCPSHEKDGTPRCCSCERMEPRDVKYVTLDDGRRLCLECLNSSIMDTSECQPLYLDIREFYEGLNMKVQQQIPLLLVEREALNEAMEAEKTDYHHLPETRGLCLAEEQIIRTVLRRPRFGPGNLIMDLITGPYRLVRHCEVTAILVLYGLPRLLTGSILAHEMMHAWLRLNGYRSLSPDVEEGICQVLAHMWLDSEIMAGSNSSASSSSSSSSSSYSSSKKGKRAEFERKLGEFFKFQIEADPSPAYGDGFRSGIHAVNNYGLRRTLDHIRYTGTFPY